jgi:ribosomal protein S18 acetylase RimI-like enzyme
MPSQRSLFQVSSKLFLSSAAAPATAAVELVTSDQEGFLNMVGSFLIDAFWLNSEHHQLGSTALDIKDSVRTSLMIEQASDLQDKYGEKMGKRVLEACVVAALDQETKEMVGVVTLKVTLLFKDNVLEGEQAEAALKNAVANLGPKQRRQYKDASAQVIATELLGPDTKAICVLSNLAVSPNARRRGIAKTLCDEAEAVAGDWGFTEMFLVVEEANAAARTLYETKLGYAISFKKEAETALRVDLETGSFEETTADTLVLVKKI